PTLRGGMVDLLHHALAVAAPGRADRHRHPVVLGYPGERGGHPPAAGIADRGHPVEPPHPAPPTEPAGHAVEAGDQVRLILPATTPLATWLNGPASRRVDARSCPIPRIRVDSAIPANPIVFHHPGHVGSPRSADQGPCGTPRRPGANSVAGCCGSGS